MFLHQRKYNNHLFNRVVLFFKQFVGKYILVVLIDFINLLKILYLSLLPFIRTIHNRLLGVKGEKPFVKKFFQLFF